MSMRTPVSLMKKTVLFSILAAGLLTAGLLAALAQQNPFSFAPRPQPDFKTRLPSLLQESWQFYKGRFLVDGAHVVSNTYDGTISEGQSYALLKAVWMNDRPTFDKVWQWTRTHMRRPADHLLGWRWDENKGLIETDNATDADQDIAYALLLAGERWQNPAYTREAQAMIADLWRLNVQAVGGRYYLVPGTWEGFRWNYLTLDPSYFAPYVYRKFAQYDPAHADGWTQLADGIYDTLEACTNLTTAKVPPNWCAITYPAENSPPRIVFSDTQGEGSRDFSYDAFRVYWRMAMDARLSTSPGRDRALAWLKTHPYPLTYWQQHRTLPEGFTAEGLPRGTQTSGFAMGPALTINHFISPAADGPLYQAMLAPHYHPDGYWFNDYNDYLHSVIWLHLYAVSLQ